MNHEELTAKIEVYEPCECATCKSGARWFMCPRIVQRFVMGYACAPKYVDATYVPSDEAVADVSKKHPGCVLVYAD